MKGALIDQPLSILTIAWSHARRLTPSLTISRMRLATLAGKTRCLSHTPLATLQFATRPRPN